MNYKLTKNLKTVQTQIFNTKLYDSLDFLKYSGDEVVHSILKVVQENPLLDIDFSVSSPLCLEENYENVSTKPSLKAHLYFQLHTSTKQYNEEVCSYIIESLEQNGFFKEDISEAAAYLKIDEDTFIDQLRLIQGFDPIGVAAFHTIDSLIIQCKYNQHPFAAQILLEQREFLLKKDYKHIAKNLHIPLENVQKEIAFIKTLSPYPCKDFYTSNDERAIPEIKIEVEDQKIIISPIKYFDIKYNDIYTDLIKEEPVLKDYFEQSKTILANLDKRNARIMLVANEIVNIQKGYFLYGDELEVCKQADVAQKLGIHPSTVSRAVSNKYYEFQNQIYPLSLLFVNATEYGNSSDAVKKAIQEILASENKSKPFSDDQIVEKLLLYNLKVSRRTVNKYRTALGIPSAGKRKHIKTK